MNCVGLLLVASTTLAAAAPAAHACISSLECHNGQICDDGACRTVAPVGAHVPELDSRMRHVGGWMFAVGLPVCAAGGIMAVSGFAGGGNSSRQVHEAIGITGAVLAGAALITWATGLALFEIGGQPAVQAAVSVTPAPDGQPSAMQLAVVGAM